MNKRTVALFLTLKTIANFFIFAGVIYLLWAFYPILKLEIGYFLSNLNTKETVVISPAPTPSISPSITPTPPPLAFTPINTEASIIIEKIDVNSPIVLDVSLADKNSYFTALNQGVAHGRGTAKPSEKDGNTYLFAHSTPNPLEIKKYGAVFTLLNKLVPNDRVTVFYKNTRYDYFVKEVKVVKSFDLSPLIDPVDVPTLTLQTCDPPGIPINRLIVRAELIQKYDLEPNSDDSV